MRGKEEQGQVSLKDSVYALQEPTTGRLAPAFIVQWLNDLNRADELIERKFLSAAPNSPSYGAWQVALVELRMARRKLRQEVADKCAPWFDAPNQS